MKRVWCWFGFHSWTSAVEQGIKPTKEQAEAGVEGFFDYAKMYCKTCGYVYKPRRVVIHPKDTVKRE